MSYDIWPPLSFYNPVCECGGKMQKREYRPKPERYAGEIRWFYGCSNYPRCRKSMSEKQGDRERNLNMPWSHPWFHGFAHCYHGDGSITDSMTGRVIKVAN